MADSLRAGSSASVLAGGQGNDLLYGASGRDVLIGGSTDHDNDLAALERVLAEWQRTDASFERRVDRFLGPNHGGHASSVVSCSTAPR